MHDILIIGCGAVCISCALILGSANKRSYVSNKKIAIFTHQKVSHLQNALFNNVLGIPVGTTGAAILESGKQQLTNQYPHIEQVDKEKVIEVAETLNGFTLITNKKTYKTKIVVIAVGYTNLMTIKGLENYTEPHPRAAEEKNRIWLKNNNHLIKNNLYVAGTLAGWRSQFAMATGSGAHVATDILTIWNEGKHTKVHDKI